MGEWGNRGKGADSRAVGTAGWTLVGAVERQLAGASETPRHHRRVVPTVFRLRPECAGQDGVVVVSAYRPNVAANRTARVEPLIRTAAPMEITATRERVIGLYPASASMPKTIAPRPTRKSELVAT
jgi:hypothetical protein